MASHSRLGKIDFSTVIPTLNPGTNAQKIIQAVNIQSSQPNRVIILDSESSDGTLEMFRDAGYLTRIVPASTFNHGGTRNIGLELAATDEVVVFLTQDALPADPNVFASLLAPFSDDSLAVVCGRQLPRPTAAEIESHARHYNYPDRPNVRSMREARSLGIKVIFNSNSCAAYRRAALVSVGGFPSNIIMGEDQIAVARLLLAGWRVAYQPSACVRHSHGYTVLEEFRRYFDIGVFHRQESTLLARFGTAGSEGRRFVFSELRYLARNSPSTIPEALLRTGAKFVGYKLGIHYPILPASMQRTCAMNRNFFSRPQTVSPRGLVASQ